MSTITKTENPETDARVKAVFDDIRLTRGNDFINNLWHYLAFDADLLEATWRDVKAVMGTPGHLDPLTRELIYTAVQSPIAVIIASTHIPLPPVQKA